MSWAYVDSRRPVMFVLDEHADTVFEDIIPHDQPRLAAAELTLASFGYRRMGDWEELTGSFRAGDPAAAFWTAEVERL